MKSLTLPLPKNTEDEIINIELFVGDSKNKCHFRIESFEWKLDKELEIENDSTSVSLSKISSLKKSIENYDKEWELLQIYAITEQSNRIRVLYKKKT